MQFANQLAELNFLRTYCRWDSALGRRENKWSEPVYRYLNWLQKNAPLPEKILKQAESALLSQEILPSMRALWSAGEAADRDNVTGYNCAFAPVDNLRALSEILYVLMNGAGIGFSVERQFVDRLPIVQKEKKKTVKITVADSTEGWAEAFYETVVALYKGYTVKHDVSLVRPQGSILKTKGGRASGPEPLLKLFALCQQIIRGAQSRRLRPIEIHDICCMVGDIVRVGGFRRAAEISFSDLEDTEMRHAKDWSDEKTFPEIRYMANNSANYTERPDRETFDAEWKQLRESGSGERGIFYLSPDKKIQRGSSQLRCNPCVTGDTLVATAQGPVQIKDLVNKPTAVVVDKRLWTSGMSYLNNTVQTTGSFSSGRKMVYALILRNGDKIRLTADHKVMTNRGWIEAQNLQKSDHIHVVTEFEKGTYVPQTTQVAEIIACGKEEVFDITVPKIHAFIANNIVVHNCGEVLLRYKLALDPWTGEGGGGSFCNLSVAVMRPWDTKKTFAKKVKLAAWIGTAQATMVHFPYLRPTWKQICMEDALIGVDITGQADNPKLSTDEQALRYFNRIAVRANKRAARHYGIPEAAAVTLGKPSGNSSVVLWSGSGFHNWYAPYFLRRIRLDAKDPLTWLLRDQGVELAPDNGENPESPSVFVATFPCKAPDGARFRDDETAIQSLERYALVMRSWCGIKGHNQSITVYVKDHEWVDVGNWVFNNFELITGISFLPYDGGKYALAPYEEITRDQYEAAIAAFPHIDFSQLEFYEKEDQGEGAQTLACSGGSCDIR